MCVVGDMSFVVCLDSVLFCGKKRIDELAFMDYSACKSFKWTAQKGVIFKKRINSHECLGFFAGLEGQFAYCCSRAQVLQCLTVSS